MPSAQVNVEVGSNRVELECPFTTASFARATRVESDASTSEVCSKRAKVAYVTADPPTMSAETSTASVYSVISAKEQTLLPAI